MQASTSRVGGRGGSLQIRRAMLKHSVNGVSSQRPFHHSVKLHCKCKVTVKSLKGTPPSRFSNKRCSRPGKMLTFDENACFTSAPRGCRPRRRLLQIRCAGTAYGDFRSKSAAQAPHLQTFATMSFQIRCTGTAYGDIRTKSAAQVPHLLTFTSMSLQIHCTGTAYAHFRPKSAAQAPHMLTFASMSLQIRCTGIAYATFVSNPLHRHRIC